MLPTFLVGCAAEVQFDTINLKTPQIRTLNRYSYESGIRSDTRHQFNFFIEANDSLLSE